MPTGRKGRAKTRASILAVIPVSGQDPEFRDGLPRLGGQSLIDFTFDAATRSRLLSHVIVSTDDRRVAAAARRAGIEAPFLRARSQRTQELAAVIEEAVRHVERHRPNLNPDWIVRLQVTFPFREPGMIDRAIRTVLAQELDSAFIAFPEYDSYWHLDADGNPERLTTDTRVPRHKRRPIYRELSGLFSMVRRDVLARGALRGSRLGILPLTSAISAIDIHGMQGDRLAALVEASRRRPRA